MPFTTLTERICEAAEFESSLPKIRDLEVADSEEETTAIGEGEETRQVPGLSIASLWRTSPRELRGRYTNKFFYSLIYSVKIDFIKFIFIKEKKC